jgi:hypothetical protein
MARAIAVRDRGRPRDGSAAGTDDEDCHVLVVVRVRSHERCGAGCSPAQQSDTRLLQPSARAGISRPECARA